MGRKKHPLRDLPARLAGMTWAEVSALADEAERDLELIPPSFRPAYEQRRGVIGDAVAAAPAATLGDLFGDRATGVRQLLATSSEVAGFSQFHSVLDADRLHMERNTFALTLGLAAYASTVDVVSALNAVPSPKSRGLGVGRPMRDDEVPLARLVVAECLYRKSMKSKRRVGFYVACEAGARASEITATTSKSFDSLDQPTDYQASGVLGARSRVLRLDPWQARSFRDLLDILLPGNIPGTPLLYRGDHDPGSLQARASSNGNVSRILDDAGLNDEQLTAKSVATQAAWTLYQAGAPIAEVAAALGIDPRKPSMAYAQLGITTDRAARTKSVVRDHPDEDFTTFGEPA